MALLTLLESGRKGMRRTSHNPAPNPQRRLSAYNLFTANFAATHPHVKGPALMERAAAAWNGGGHSMASNPGRKGHKKGKRHNPVDNPLSSNPKKGHKAKSHRRTSRNPFGIEKVTNKAFGVGFDEMIAAGATVLAVEFTGGLIADSLNKDLVPRAEGDNRFDLMYVVRKTAPRALAGIGAYYMAKWMGAKPAIVRAVGITAAGTTILQAAGASRVAPTIVKDGSLLINHRETYRLPPPRAGLLPPPPPPSMGYADAPVQMRHI
ncbi:MAG: hypothetical protein NTZ05_01920 [Chloroflexi bacterium]|nr:hypothetical protein [Chloroflexota bacterium]